ncbi:MAG TPA: sigma-70 family RNA polymerase sigma factor [Gemmataceae bacterium]|nr:sigma-70 family RNA polymerase sigma factor [Gemmataceae bacterium]
MTTASLHAVARYVRHLSEQDTRALSDFQLLDRFTTHQDEAAFTELVRRHGPMVLGVCRRVLNNGHDAEDAFQAAFLVLVRKAASIRQHDAISGWLYRVAYRLALRARARRSRTEKREGRIDEAILDPRPSILDPHSELEEEVQRLPEQYRSAVVLCYLEGRTQTEAARLLATTTTAVNSRLKRARDLLRQRLARRGLALSSTAVATALSASAARAALPAALLRSTARTALDFAANPATACGVSALAAALAKGALHSTMTPKLKILSILALLVALVTTGAFLVPSSALGDPAGAPAQAEQPPPPKPGDAPQPKGGKQKPQRSVILLWMSGGPSQLDTFDLKPGTINGGPFRAINTAAKGMQISEHLPRLAKLTNHLAILRTVKHREGDHMRGAYLMRTGYRIDNQTEYPTLPCLLGKELGEGRPDLPRYVNIAGLTPRLGGLPNSAGFLGPTYAPLAVGERVNFREQPPEGAGWLPPVEAFEALAKGKGEKMRNAVAKAFDLSEEKADVRDAYGRTPFGQGCLLARRLVERGVPVVEVTLPGWDTHVDNFTAVEKLSAQLDAAWASLLKDLHERKKLDSTLIVWMGEFGRTPKINVNNGRDHWPLCFSVVLAGCGIKGGTVVGKTSADGTQIEEREVKPTELHATIYAAVGIDWRRTNLANTGRPVSLAEKASQPMKEVLR